MVSKRITTIHLADEKLSKQRKVSFETFQGPSNGVIQKVAIVAQHFWICSLGEVRLLFSSVLFVVPVYAAVETVRGAAVEPHHSGCPPGSDFKCSIT